MRINGMVNDPVPLSEADHRIVLDRLEHLIGKVIDAKLPEEKALTAIGRLVDGTIRDVTFIITSSSRVQPSILPPHDSTTIDNMALWQNKLRSSRLPPQEQALYLDRLEHAELITQKEDRYSLTSDLYDDEELSV